MRDLGPATEDEVVLAFVRAELGSPRWGRRYRCPAGFILEQLLAPGDRTDAAQNAARRQMLNDVRGYPDRWLFAGFPRDVSWRRVELVPEDLSLLRYIAEYPPDPKSWVVLSGGTRRVVDAVANVDTSPTFPWDARQGIQAVAEGFKAGSTCEPVIAVEGEDGALVLIEGHVRATGYARSDVSIPLPAFVGRSARMAEWRCY
jgi:hypothetical protein